MTEVAAAITTIGVLLCVAIGAVAMRGRRDAEAGEHVDLVVDHQLLREAARGVGHGGVVLDDHLDLAAGDRVAVLRHVELDRRVDLPAGGGLLAGHRQDQADLDRAGVGSRRPARTGRPPSRRRPGHAGSGACTWWDGLRNRGCDLRLSRPGLRRGNPRRRRSSPLCGAIVPAGRWRPQRGSIH